MWGGVRAALSDEVRGGRSHAPSHRPKKSTSARDRIRRPPSGLMVSLNLDHDSPRSVEVSSDAPPVTPYLDRRTNPRVEVSSDAPPVTPYLDRRTNPGVEVSSDSPAA
ncbi:hypothetical protein BN12_1310002 [Nostocoides japonicum T1-X7]|uniref:Uncharacterized protein n=1 Tax=Nostocoides japonicum T1-X7 TaxID=1194083 RepID=A0A077LTI5_9MICO|nr:hypothetical protein BN12_1310002 [Tetrasphaera japonica T1-X7]